MTGSMDHYYHQNCDWCKAGEFRVDIRAGDVICISCGSVQQSRILDTSDEINIHEEERETKSGRASGFADAYGCTDTLFLTGEASTRQSLERAQKASLNRTEKSISKYLHLVMEVCAALDLPPAVKEEGIRLFVTVHQSKILPSRSHQPAVAASCVFLSCRLCGYPRLIEEISLGCGSHNLDIDISVIYRMQTEIARHLLVANDRGSGEYQGLRTITRAADLYFRFATRLQQSLSLDHPGHAYSSPSQQQTVPVGQSMFSAAVKEQGRMICERMDELELTTGTPQLAVAVVLAWLAVLIGNAEGDQGRSGGVSIARIAITCFITPGQIATHAKGIYPSLRMVLPSALVERLDAVEAAIISTQSGTGNDNSDYVRKKMVALFARSDGLIICPLSDTAVKTQNRSLTSASTNNGKKVDHKKKRSLSDVTETSERQQQQQQSTKKVKKEVI